MWRQSFALPARQAVSFLALCFTWVYLSDIFKVVFGGGEFFLKEMISSVCLGNMSLNLFWRVYGLDDRPDM